MKSLNPFLFVHICEKWLNLPLNYILYADASINAPFDTHVGLYVVWKVQALKNKETGNV